MIDSDMKVRSIKLVLLPLIVLVAGVTSQLTVVRPPLVSDMRQSYDLLSQTFYKPIDKRTLLSGLRNGVENYLSAQGRHVPLPAVTHGSVADPVAYFNGVVRLGATISKTNADLVAYAALHGMAESAQDRWTQYLDPKEFAAFNDFLDPPDVSGIGVLLSVDPVSRCAKVFFVIPNGPADKAGVQDGDLLTAVDERAVCGLSHDAISKRLLGKSGSVLHIAISRGGHSIGPSIALIRAHVQPPTVYFSMLPQSIAYVSVLVFGTPTSSEFSEALRRLLAQQPRALILDLRDDGGGYVQSAVSVASHFLSSGTIFSSVSRDGTITYDTDYEQPQVDIPVAVLVNGDTASASEIVASALSENGIAELVGTKTFGKGVEQTVSRFPDDSAIKITTARYLTAAGHDLNGVGIEPQIVAKENSSPSFGVVDQDSQLRAAVQYLTSAKSG